MAMATTALFTPGPAHGRDAHREQQAGDAEEDVHDAVDGVVPGAAQVARGEPEGAAEQHRHADGGAGDVERDARAVDDAAQHVAPEAIGAEQRLARPAAPRSGRSSARRVDGARSCPRSRAAKRMASAENAPARTRPLRATRRTGRAHRIRAGSTAGAPITPSVLASTSVSLGATFSAVNHYRQRGTPVAFAGSGMLCSAGSTPTR